MKRLRIAILWVSFALLFWEVPAAFGDVDVSIDLRNFDFGGGSLEVTADSQTLTGDVVYGRDFVLPIRVSSRRTLRTRNTSIALVYRLYYPSDTPMGLPVRVPITHVEVHPRLPNTLRATAIIERRYLRPLQRGGLLKYHFETRHAGRSLALSPSTGDHQLNFVESFRRPVDSQGGVFIVPDTHATDDPSAITIAPGAISGNGTLIIKREDPDSVQPGPRGIGKPEVVYSFSLEGAASLHGVARLRLGYPSNLDGSVGDSHVSAYDLAPYFLENPSPGWQNPIPEWRLLSRPVLDTTMHTISGVTTHLSTFALFPTGPVSAADLRPKERIITPNGDGINDTATFTGLTDTEEVHLFDIRGRRVRTLKGPSPVWDGRDDEGSIVESGIYIYQYTSQGDRVSGVINVAK